MSVDKDIFKGMESGMLKGIFKNVRFKGIERGPFIKDIGNEEMDIDRSIGDLESDGGVVSAEGKEAVVSQEKSCVSLVIVEPVIVVGVELGGTSVD